MNFDEVLSQIGGFGRFQKTLYVWICLPQVFLAFHMLVSVFTGATPPHQCRVDCSEISPDSRSTAEAPGAPGGSNGSLGLSQPPECSRGGHGFSKEVFLNTIVTEWDLVCEDAYLNSVGSAVYMFGLLVGAVLFGILADRFGRRSILLSSLVLQAGFGVAAAFAPNFCIYSVLRFCVGVTVSGVIMNAFVLGTEWTGSQHRMLAGIMTDYFFGFGTVLLAGVAYVIRDWRMLQLAISAPGFLFLFYIRVLPQSARWLMVNGRLAEAMDLIHRAAKVNGKQSTVMDVHQRLTLTQKSHKKPTVLELLRTPRMRKHSLILFYVWFVNILVYYGLSLNVADFGTNIYVTQMIFGLVEIPARTIALFTLKRSRRMSLLAFLTVGGGACLFILTLPHHMFVMRTVLAMLGKFGITASLSVVYVYTAEVFPTVIRQSAIGVSSMCARLGGVLAPLIYLSKKSAGHTPIVLFGVCPLVGAALTILLPETVNKPLPETIEDVEGLSRSGQSRTEQDRAGQSSQSCKACGTKPC